MCGFGSSTDGNGFGQPTSNPTPGFGTSANNTGGFGTTSGFGQAYTPSVSGTGNGFVLGTSNRPLNGGSPQTPTNGGLFGSNQQHQAAGLFGGSSFGSFGGQAHTRAQTPSLFGQTNNNANSSAGFGSHGATNSNAAATSLFGTSRSASGGLFGNATSTTNTSSGGLFGGIPPSNNMTTGGGLFSNSRPSENTTTSGGLFGNTGPSTNVSGGGLFGQPRPANTGGLFGHVNNTQATGFPGCSTQNNSGGGLFGQQPASTSVHKDPFGNIIQETMIPAAWEHTCGEKASHGGCVLVAPSVAGTASVPFQPFVEKETNGTINYYQHLCMIDPYWSLSTEELRLCDYNAGRRYARAQPPHPFHTTRDLVSKPVEHGAGMVAEDNEIRALKAQILILENRLRQSTRAREPAKLNSDNVNGPRDQIQQTGPLKGDPSIPVNPDPRTNNSGRDLRPSRTVSGACSTQAFTSSNFPFANNNTEPKSPEGTTNIAGASASTIKPPVSDTSSKVEGITSQFESRFKDIESQLHKVTELLEKQSLLTTKDDNTAVEQATNNAKCKQPADEEVQTGTGASTPAVLVFTPDSSADSPVAAEQVVDLGTVDAVQSTSKAKDFVKTRFASLAALKITVYPSPSGCSQHAHEIVCLLKSSKRQSAELQYLHITEIAALTSMNIREAVTAIEELLWRKSIARSGDDDHYGILE